MKYYSVLYQVFRNGELFKQDFKGLHTAKKTLSTGIAELKNSVVCTLKSEFPGDRFKVAISLAGIEEVSEEVYKERFATRITYCASDDNCQSYS